MRKIGKDWYLIEDLDDQIIGIKYRKGTSEETVRRKMHKILKVEKGLKKLEVMEVWERQVPKTIFGGARGECSVKEGRWKPLR